MDINWTERRESWENNREDARNAWETDFGRIIHSSSFRRLQGKTQILNLGDSDFYRTRLTHSIEVAQVARGLVKQLQKNEASDDDIIDVLPSPILAQAIGSTHDLGHPPFGHGGEYALNYCMRAHGGFEGNGQTLRILSRLERFSESAGSNLTRRSLLGVLKYPVPFSKAKGATIAPQLSASPTSIRILDIDTCKPPKCYHDSEQDVVDWILAPFSDADRDRFLETKTKNDLEVSVHKSFDCSIMDLADDIAFGVHDLEDMIAMRLFSEQDFRELVSEESCKSYLDYYAQKAPAEVGNDVYEWLVQSLFGNANEKKRTISRFVGHFITSARVIKQGVFEAKQLDYRASLPPEQLRFLKALKDAVYLRVIKSAEVQHLEFKGQQLVVAVFEAYRNNPERLLPSYAISDYEASVDKERFICDHVAGMTDSYLLNTYERLFSPRLGSTFDRL